MLAHGDDDKAKSTPKGRPQAIGGVAPVAQKRPPFLLLENVPGLLSHDGGRTFATILHALSDLGYHVEWTVLNSSHFGVPQARRRVFLICYLDGRCAGEILPVFGTGGKALVQLVAGRQGNRVYDPDGLACTQTCSSGGMGGKTGFYLVGINRKDGITEEREVATTLTTSAFRGINRNQTQNAVLVANDPLPIKEATKKGYKDAYAGDSVNLGFAGNNTRRGRVGRDIAHTLDTGSSSQGVVLEGGRIRRLVPRECLRLQGFEESQIDEILAIQSDTQVYKQAGNSVTVNVIEAIGYNIRKALEGGYGRD